jgi:hypothetical protein
MSLTGEQSRQLDVLLKKYTDLSSNSDNDVRMRDGIVYSIRQFLRFPQLGPMDLHLSHSYVKGNAKTLFTEIVNTCFPGATFTCQEHTGVLRNETRPTDTRDYSGATAYVFTLPTRTVRFYTKLYKRRPEWGVVHQWWMTGDDVEYDSEVDTDDEGLKAQMTLICSILDTLHTRLAHLETTLK